MAQPFYQDYSPAYVNIIACATDADCLNPGPPQGAGFMCYTATYKQGVSAGNAGGWVVSTSSLCLPEDLMEFYSAEPLVIQESAREDKYDSWLFNRIVPPATTVTPLKACLTNLDCL